MNDAEHGEITIEQLLAPLRVERFYNDYWDSSIAHIPNSPWRRNFITSHDIDSLFAQLSDGESVSVTRTLGSKSLCGFNPNRKFDGSNKAFGGNLLYTALSQGFSVKIGHAERYSNKILRTRGVLERHIQQPANDSSVFVSPPGSQAFPPHVDDEHTFTLQLVGTKQWFFYKRISERRRGEVDEDETGSLHSSIVLRPGDLLYVPRGLVHKTVSGETMSLSVSFGFKGITYSDVLERALSIGIQHLSEADTELSRSFPCNWLGSEQSRDQVCDASARLLIEHLQNARAEWLKLAMKQVERESVESMVVEPSPHLLAMEMHNEILLSTVVVRRPGTLCLVQADSDYVYIVFPGGGCMRGGLQYKGAFQFVASHGGEFVAADLPGELTDQQRIRAVKSMLNNGLLSLSKPSEQNMSPEYINSFRAASE